METECLNTRFSGYHYRAMCGIQREANINFEFVVMHLRDKENIHIT